MSTMSVSEAVASRRSIRAFLDKPVPLEVLRRVMDKARMSPSGCNFQPWEATILSGEPLRALQAEMMAATPQQPAEYIITPPDIDAEYKARLAANGAKMGAAEGVARDDSDGRARTVARNMVSFGAPAVLLCYTPRVMGPPQWSDIGMWLQTVMLLLREEGLDSCAQEYLSIHARLIKRFIGIDDERYVFFCGMGIGWRDPDAPINCYERDRVPLDEQVKFAGF